MLNTALQNSKIRKVIKESLKKYRFFEDIVEKVYKDSVICNKAKAFRKSMVLYLNQSFFGKITGERSEVPLYIGNSKAVDLISYFIELTKKKIIICLDNSEQVAFINRTKTDFQTSSLRTIGIIVFVAILTNITLAILLRKSIDLLEWVIRAGFLFVGFGALYCRASWDEVKKTSLVVTLFKKACKNLV